MIDVKIQKPFLIGGSAKVWQMIWKLEIWRKIFLKLILAALSLRPRGSRSVLRQVV